MNKIDPAMKAPPTESVNILQIRKIGNSLGLILPKELLAQLKLAEGDRLTVIEQPERAIKLSPYEDKHARAMAFARRAFKDYANTFRELAK